MSRRWSPGGGVGWGGGPEVWPMMHRGERRGPCTRPAQHTCAGGCSPLVQQSITGACGLECGTRHGVCSMWLQPTWHTSQPAAQFRPGVRIRVLQKAPKALGSLRASMGCGAFSPGQHAGLRTHATTIRLLTRTHTQDVRATGPAASPGADSA